MKKKNDAAAETVIAIVTDEMTEIKRSIESAMKTDGVGNVFFLFHTGKNLQMKRA